MIREQESSQSKTPWLVLAPLCLWLVLIVVVIWPWMRHIDGTDLWFSFKAGVSATIWWLVLLWSMHSLAFQVGSFFLGKVGKVGNVKLASLIRVHKKDIYNQYEIGMHRLLDLISSDQEIYRDTLVYQQRLFENINICRRYGDNDILRHERNQIIDMLNGVVISFRGVSFHDFCVHNDEEFNAKLTEVSTSPTPYIAILYVTCDDFVESSCISCLQQDYKMINVYICDDSKKSEYKEIVARFCANNPDIHLIKRPIDKGFKAGNINYAIKNFVQEEWILLVDADQYLPSNYVSQFVHKLPGDSGVAFLQGAHEAQITSSSSIFQKVLSIEIPLYYYRDLVARNSYGFVPMLGHGVFVRKSIWSKVGGFPEIVSEDFAYSLRISNLNVRGLYIDNIVSHEAFPHDFGGFMIRLKKFAGGTAEILCREMMAFLKGSASYVEKWDFIMMLSWYIIMPLVTINGFLSASVVHELWEKGVPFLHPILPYLYIWMFLSIFVIIYSIARGMPTLLNFYFWSTAIYASAMPLAGVSFIKHLFVPPNFVRTPKNGEVATLSTVEHCFMVMLGLAAVMYAAIWFSPFSPVLAGQGLAYLGFPLYARLNSHSHLGRFARLAVYGPGVLMLVALYTMWFWGRY
jgi:cellulose synthase/poly-beta-1,6-N-acetylglucosamine synthase-like glycosyltransferase